MSKQYIIPRTTNFKNFGIVTLPSGRYICPGWVLIEQDTQLSDCKWSTDKEQKDSVDQQFQIKGSTDKLYNVTLSLIRGNHCTCQAFAFRKSCKHIELAKNLQK